MVGRGERRVGQGGELTEEDENLYIYACRGEECVELRSTNVSPEFSVCLPHCPTGAAVPELQLFGRFGGNPILLATTEQLTYFDCRSFVKCVCHSNSPWSHDSHMCVM